MKMTTYIYNDKIMRIYLNIIIITSKWWTFIQKTVRYWILGIIAWDKSMSFIMLLTFYTTHCCRLRILN